MKVLLLLISLFTTIYLSGCAGCSNSERKGRHSNRGRERKVLPINDTLSLAPKGQVSNTKGSIHDSLLSQNILSYKVIAIIDGDTYDILDEKKIIRIRMDGIDAPERGMPYNKVSKKYLSDLIFGKIIQVKMGELDKYDRTIAQTYLLDGTDVSLEMIRAGLAWHFKKYSSNEEYAKVEVEARGNKLGLWQENNPIPPWDVRMLHRNGVSTKELFKDSPK